MFIARCRAAGPDAEAALAFVREVSEPKVPTFI
jgi:hypothetical protein